MQELARLCVCVCVCVREREREDVARSTMAIEKTYMKTEDEDMKI